MKGFSEVPLLLKAMLFEYLFRKTSIVSVFDEAQVATHV